jgi:hypothetical protein
MPDNVLVRIATTFLGVTAVVLLASAPVAADEHERRAKVPSQRAQGIAGELFPEKCGNTGVLCGITYGADYCPLQFVISFPAAKEAAPSEPSAAWVTVDQRGNVIEVSSRRAKDCRNGVAS